MLKKGRIIKVISGFYDVKTNDNKIIRLRASGYLRDNNIIPVVGDIVEYRDEKVIDNISERKNFLIRPKVANVDCVAIVVSLDKPKFSSLLLDRFLAIVEFQNIETMIIFTKADIGDNRPYYDYKSQNFNCVLINNNNDENFKWNETRKIFENKLVVFTGQSGVGKSTTINHLLNSNQETNEISNALGRGKHTTRVVEIISNENIEIIDTPGFGSIEVTLTKEQLAKSYFDFKKWSKECKFSSCLHYKENSCKVKEQLENGKLLKSRYDNYIKILLELKDNDW